MFYLTTPVMLDECLGNAVLCNDGRAEWCVIQLVEGFGTVGLIRLWREEAHAVSSGRRRRGLLPTRLARDMEGRLGFMRGFGVVSEGEDLYVYDEAELLRSFSCPPCEWWKSIVDPRRQAGCDRIGPISVSSFASWADSLDELLYGMDVTIDTFGCYRECMERNRALLNSCLEGLAGGKELLSVFPADYMDQMGFIWRCRCKGGESIVEILGDAAMHEFDKELWPKRSTRELTCWVKQMHGLGNIVVFLCPRGNADRGMPLFVLRPGDDIASALPNALEASRIDSDAVDCVAFSTRCNLLSARSGEHMAILSKSGYRQLVKGASRVLLGVSKRTAWVEFPLALTQEGVVAPNAVKGTSR